MSNQTGKPKTLSSLIMDYLAKNNAISRSTKQLTIRAANYLILAVGNLEVVDFDLADAEDYQNWLLGKYSTATTNIYCKTVRPIFRWAVRHRDIEADPFENLRLLKVATKRIRIYSIAEVQAILDAALNNMWRSRIIAAVSAGLRRGEVLNLTVDDIDFENGVIYVQAKKESPLIWKWQPKDRDVRTLPLAAQLNNLLVKLITELPAGQPYLMLTEKRYWHLQRLRFNGLMSDRMRECPDENFSRPFKKILRRAGIKHGTFHDLRRTWVTCLLESGLEPHAVQELAGHSSVETTMRFYAGHSRPIIDRART
ncbi:site-specific integrase, partial [Candidatus Pacearchaeota archaeon]|nr:site-specific integrase [Candidatus Pacearchaeota archaeon]